RNSLSAFGLSRAFRSGLPDSSDCSFPSSFTSVLAEKAPFRTISSAPHGAPFNDVFEMLLFCLNEPLHVTFQKKPQEPVELENVAHESAAVARMKLVDVTQSLEPGAHDLVDDAPWRFDVR